MKRRSAWGSRFGFYMAAIGSSFGLGNLWRFPYVVESNGGGAFVLLYVFLAFVVGMPLLIAEFMLGKVTRQSAVPAFESLSQPGWSRILPWFGRLAVVLSLFLLSYYAVISGWVIYFLKIFASLLFSDGAVNPGEALAHLRSSGILQFGLSALHVSAVLFVVARGVQEGIEKWVGYIMSVFAILVLALVIRTLSLPGAEKALRFLFYPNFSMFTSSTLIEVLGHIFFTLTIGVGAMTTFGSYLNDRIYVPGEGYRVALLDTIISMLAGFLIFQIIFSVSGGIGDRGPQLLFESIPLLFSELSFGAVFGFAFFLCLYMAALGASIGLLEVSVSYLMDRRKVSRLKATLIMGVAALALSLFPALSSTAFKSINVGGQDLIGILDAVLINWILPIGALGISLAVGFKMKDAVKRKEFMASEMPGLENLYSNWVFVLKWLAPLLILGALLIHIVGLINGAPKLF